MNSAGKNKQLKVLVALSGGVDSAVSAALLKKQGYLVEGAHMVCWNEGPYCTSDQDRAYAARVAAGLGIPFQVFDFQKEYRQAVINYFVGEYEAGRTPNPDVACNKEIKFGIFLKKALELGFDYIATGHYAQVKYDKTAKKYKLLAGVDSNKDQSYFLYQITQDQLAKTLFPVGHLTKPQVRELALKLNLPNANKKDSQGICFIGDVEIREFLSKRIKSKIGNIINTKGRVIGKHDGVAFYTIGQREGVGVSEKIPHYIVSKDTKTNTLVAAPFGSDSLYKNDLQADSINWIGEKPEVGEFVEARIRYRQPLFKAKITYLRNKKIGLEPIEPQQAVTSGQSLVMYRNAETLGGGIII